MNLDSVFNKINRIVYSKCDMFKMRIYLVWAFSLLCYSQVADPLPQLNSVTSCLGNCVSCAKSPYICDNINSLKYPGENFNCISYYFGANCSQFSNGFINIDEGTTTGWRQFQSAVTRVTQCPVSNTTVGGLGTFQNTTISKSIGPKIFPNTNSLIVQLGVFIKISKEQTANQTAQNNTGASAGPDANVNDLVNIGIGGGNQPPPQAITNEATVIDENGFRYFLRDITVSVKDGVNLNKSFKLKYDYQQIANNQISSLCGKYFQFITQVALPEGTNTNRIVVQISSQGAENTSWALGSFKVSGGCSSFMIFTPEAGCSYCESGFSSRKNNDDTVASCSICPIQCETCDDNNKCLTCSSAAQYTSIQQNCILNKTYSVIKTTNSNSSQTLTSAFFGEIHKTNNNIMRLSSELETQRNYSIEFYLLYRKNITEQNGLKYNFYVNDKLQKQINASALNKITGFFQPNIFSNSTQKVYADKIVLQNIKFDKKAINVSVNASNSQQGTFAVANMRVIQQKCPKNCKECSLVTGKCSACQSFLQSESNCKTCPNGMYLQLGKTSDQCIKCHSTCKQCTGPSITQCSQCLQSFTLQRIQYNETCIRCIYDKNTAGECSMCFQIFQNNNFCNLCLQASTFDNVLNGDICQKCWLLGKMGAGRCVPTTEGGYKFYGTDAIEGFTDTQTWSTVPDSLKTQRYNLSNNYINIFGIPNSQAPKTQLRWNSKTLPQHNGLIIILNIFLTDLTANKILKISLYDGDNLENSEQITINKTVGSNINQKTGNQMIYSYAFRSNGHNRTQNVNLRIETTQGGIYVRQFQVYLKDCNKCIEDQLVYTFGYIPRYHYEGNVTQGLDIWLDFKKKLQNTPNIDLKKAFTFSFIELPGVTLEPTQFYNQLQDNQRLKYFIPLKFSFINYTLAINTTQDQRIFAKTQARAPENIRRMLTRMLLVSQLNIPRNQEAVNRFTSFKSDDQISANQLYWFFRTIQWFVLIVMIVCAFFGIGVIFEDFSIVLQILFLHVYISSNLLPATYKAPMWGLQRMENLNFFSDPDIANIQSSWFGDLVYPSPYVFQQYNIDIYFARSYYPIIIINLIYLGWFIILAVLNKFVKAFKNSQFIGAIFLRSIPERPINYFDQIWRYQFLTTCWAALMQFHNLNGRNGTQRLNIALCFIAFIISLIWPIFIIIYTYRKTLYNYSTNFNYYYEDIFFKKHESFGEENWKYYLYIAIRFLRILGIALFIALFTNHELVGAIVLIFLNLIEIIYIAELRIFVKDILAFFLKFAENILLIFIEIALLVVYGTSNTMDERSFLNLGYAILVMYVIIIVFAFIRFIYYAYSKFKYYRLKFYGVDGGDKKTYGMTPLPKTDRE